MDGVDRSRVERRVERWGAVRVEREIKVGTTATPGWVVYLHIDTEVDTVQRSCPGLSTCLTTS
jgi:hypothetical protein